ncbi:beta-arrestin-1-like [Petromyzon marinus]|uniref:beta-arrestin-1-like n=1 Tax=Petromyzon marinus TaxID=7757 RepID=UPI003F701516
MAAKTAHVFKKTSSNGKVTVYMAKRDFIDHLDHVDPVDGVVYVDPAYIKGRKVYVSLTCAFRYGRDDFEVIGIPFRRDIHVTHRQLYPPCQGPPATAAATSLQDRLLNKLGGTAYPFSFSMPQNLPCSVTMQPAPSDKDKSCGVDFEVKAFCCEKLDEDIKKKHSVSLLIRKVQFAPEKPGISPSGIATVDSDSPVTLDASPGQGGVLPRPADQSERGHPERLQQAREEDPTHWWVGGRGWVGGWGWVAWVGG